MADIPRMVMRGGHGYKKKRRLDVAQAHRNGIETISIRQVGDDNTCSHIHTCIRMV